MPKKDRERYRLPARIGKGKKLVRFQLFLAAALLSNLVFFTLLPPFVWPLRARVTSEFLFRIKPEASGWEIHHGIDLGAPTGTPVSPSAIGFVTEQGSSPILGNYVVVSHLFGFSTLYAHLSRATVHQGQLVFPGIDRVGLSGSTGRSTGPHLHFSVRLCGIPLPPRLFLAFHDLRLKILKF